MHRIGEPKKTKGKTRPTIVKFIRYNNQNRVFRNKKKLKGQKISMTETLTKTRMDKLKQAKETYGFTNVWTNDRKFSLNQIPMLNHKFTIANSFIILIRPSIRRQSLSYESFGSSFYMLGDL